jgi:putative ABC transport system permease protein
MAVVVNQTLVKRYWGGVSPLGAHVGVNGTPATIVGVVADVHHGGPAAIPDAEMYAPYVQLSARQGWLVLRTSGDPSTVAASLRAAMREVDPNLPLARVRSMASLVSDSIAEPRFLATLLTWFSSVAALLALMGVYGLLSFSVSRRVREIGVRMALGASRRSVVGLVMRQSLAVVVSGVIAGAAAAFALSQIIKTLLFGVRPGDLATTAAMAVLIVAASLIASFVPAQRAAGIQPVVALRDE